MKWIFDVEVPLVGSDQWLAVARCMTPGAVGEIVEALARHSDGKQLRVTPIAVSDDEPLPAARSPAGSP